MFDINTIIRPHILRMKPYSSARDEYTGTQGIFLDANENAYGSPGIEPSGEGFHRYPDPHQVQLKQRISEIKGVAPDHIFLGNGSDEAIDLIIRAFCNPGVDNIVINAPTYGMYQVAADAHNVAVHEALLTQDFDIDSNALAAAVNAQTKLIFFCSPNNPTGNLLNSDIILAWARKFSGLVVVDEAYIDFTETAGFLEVLADTPNLVVLQTLSKAWGMAALRLGMAFGSTDMISVLNKIKPPYNINGLTQEKALEILAHPNQQAQLVSQLMQQRKQLTDALNQLPFVTKVYPSAANFLLVKVSEPDLIFHYLIQEKVIVRDRSKVVLCEGCLRITVGTAQENQGLIQKLTSWSLRQA